MMSREVILVRRSSWCSIERYIQLLTLEMAVSRRLPFRENGFFMDDVIARAVYKQEGCAWQQALNWEIRRLRIKSNADTGVDRDPVLYLLQAILS